MDSNLVEYNRIIGLYRQVWAKIRSLQKRQAEKEVRFAEDKRRDALHKQLRVLAAKIGKTSQDVDIDILISEKDLSEYQIPEFRLLRIESSGLVNPEIIKLDGGNVLEPYRNKKTLIPKNELSATGLDLFIPFGEERSWHLFDQDVFFEREPDNLEKRRRALSVVGGNLGASFVEVSSSESFHNKIKLFGIAFSSKDFDILINYLSTNRAEISIAKEFLNPEQVRKDFKEIIENNVDYIAAYDNGEFESNEYLLKRYLRVLNGWQIDDEFKLIASGVLSEAISRAEEKELRERVEKEVEKNLVKDAEYETLFVEKDSPGLKKSFGRRGRV
jgi:hypothetical protein